VTFACAQIAQAGDSGGQYVAAGAIILAFIGFGFPIAVTAGVFTRGKKLYKKTAKSRFLPTHGTVHLLKIKWAALPIIKKLLIAMVFGFINVKPTAQLVLVLLIYIAYVFSKYFSYF
jgi:hypothetical protein